METLFLNGLLIDGLGGVVEGGGVLVDGERIVDAGRGLESRRGSGTRVIDLAGRTIMPGLIDTHVHLAGGDFFPGYVDENLGMAAFRTAEDEGRAYLPQRAGPELNEAVQVI